MYKFSNGHVKWTVIIALAIVLLLVLSLCRTKFRAKIGVMFVGPKLGQKNIKNAKKKNKAAYVQLTDHASFYSANNWPRWFTYILWHTFIASFRNSSTAPPAGYSFNLSAFASSAFSSVSLAYWGGQSHCPPLIGARKCGSKTFFSVITIGYYNYHYP